MFPVLDEETLIKALSAEVGPNTTELIRSGAVLSLIDAFDRRLPRNVFLDILSHSLPLYDWLGCLDTVRRMSRLQNQQKLTEAALAEAVAEYMSTSDSVRAYLLSRMKLVVTCAPSTATIH